MLLSALRLQHRLSYDLLACDNLPQWFTARLAYAKWYLQLDCYSCHMTVPPMHIGPCLPCMKLSLYTYVEYYNVSTFCYFYCMLPTPACMTTCLCAYWYFPTLLCLPSGLVRARQPAPGCCHHIIVFTSSNASLLRHAILQLHIISDSYSTCIVRIQVLNQST